MSTPEDRKEAVQALLDEVSERLAALNGAADDERVVMLHQMVDAVRGAWADGGVAEIFWTLRGGRRGARHYFITMDCGGYLYTALYYTSDPARHFATEAKYTALANERARSSGGWGRLTAPLKAPSLISITEASPEAVAAWPGQVYTDEAMAVVIPEEGDE